MLYSHKHSIPINPISIIRRISPTSNAPIARQHLVSRLCRSLVQNAQQARVCYSKNTNIAYFMYSKGAVTAVETLNPTMVRK